MYTLFFTYNKRPATPRPCDKVTIGGHYNILLAASWTHFNILALLSLLWVSYIKFNEAKWRNLIRNKANWDLRVTLERMEKENPNYRYAQDKTLISLVKSSDTIKSDSFKTVSPSNDLKIRFRDKMCENSCIEATTNPI